MLVKSLELINLRSFKATKLHLSENVNILIGANNSGKSTIIKALLNLQYRTFESSDVRAGELYSKIFTELDALTDFENAQLLTSGAGIEHENAKEITVAWGQHFDSQSNEQNLFFNSKLKIKRLEYDVIEARDELDKIIALKEFPRFPDSEHLINFIYPFLAKRKSEYYLDQNVNHEQSYKIMEVFRNLASKIQKIGNPSHPKNREFNSLCDDILNFRIGVLPIKQNGMNGIEPGIYVTNESMIPIRAMGEGVVNIVAFLVTILTEDNKLYLIEEIENDIHPKALKKLLNLIVNKAGKNQFLVSTHSNIVLRHLGAVFGSKIFYVDWSPFVNSEEGRKEIPTSTVTEIENKPELRLELLEKLGYEFQDFELHQAYLLLEESSAESIIRDFLIPNMVPGLLAKLKPLRQGAQVILRAESWILIDSLSFSTPVRYIKIELGLSPMVMKLANPAHKS